jgi:ribA/ribD-fused uncharacterized protein
MEIIDRFADEYYWLSNFADSPIIINSVYFPTVEHYFQASKATSSRSFEMIKNAESPSEAKKLGKNIALREDWEQIKDAVIYTGVKAKFVQNLELQKRLLNTGNTKLVEGNNWHDYYWGVCNGKGKNKLGKILMQVREELRNGNYN